MREHPESALLGWIHLSDIHFGHGDAAHGWDQRLVLDRLREDLAEQCRQHRPDVLFITGDIAFSGKREQYEQARVWLDSVLHAIGLGPERVFMVPGNHDVDRSVDRDRDTARLLRELRAGTENLDAALAHEPDRAKLAARMAAYLDFAGGFAPERARTPPRPAPERLFWQHRELHDRLPLRIIGLDTALLAADDQDRGRLYLGKEQLARALAEPPRAPGELVIVLGHHPLQGGWLADEREAASWLRNHAHVHLFGHIHEASSEAARQGTGAHFVQVAAGAAHAEKQPAGVPAGHGYVLGEILADEHGALRLRLWPRRWSGNHARFVVDVDNVPPGEHHADHALGARLPRTPVAHDARPAVAPPSATATSPAAPPAATPPDPLQQKLADAQRRKRDLEQAGLPVAQVNAEIRALKDELLRGGQLRPGVPLGERYLLSEQIGHGGFATVWKARDLAGGEDVAVKILHPNLAGDMVRRSRFFRGARIMAELAHPNLVRIREREAEDHGFYYFVMDYIAGGNLEAAVLARRVQGEQAVPIILRIGEVLGHAHARGHVHRDVKPLNILLAESGEPLLNDFDLVTAQDTAGGTRTGALGTFIYAAPEMMEQARDADARADVYGLGMTAAFVLHGDRLPRKALTGRERFIDELGCAPDLKEILKRATADDAQDRYRDAAAFCEALRLFQTSLSAGDSLAKPIPGSELHLPAEAMTGPTPATPETPPEESPEVSMDMLLVAAPQAFVEPLTGIRFLWVPGGTFTMGAEDLGNACRPPHRVRVSPFWLAETPVTNRQYEKFLKQRDVEEPRYWRDGRYNQPEQPAVGVSWREARAFCRWLSEVSGRHVELPTEAQWEFAARGEESRNYPWGDEMPDERHAHFGKHSKAPLPVGILPAGQGPYGHQDLAGNVWEWCLDAWDERAYGKRGTLVMDPPQADGSGGDEGGVRACRGGAFYPGRKYLRSAFRDRRHADDKSHVLGFRVAALPAISGPVSP